MIEFLYSQGTSPVREDGLIVTGEILFGVLDGVSAPYSPKYPAKKFAGLSGGEMIVRFCEQFAEQLVNLNLRQFVLRLNAKVGEQQGNTPPGELAGAVFAFALVKNDCVEIVQAGDCLAVVEMKNGDVFVTPNQVRRHDTEMNAEIEHIMREVAQEIFGIPIEKLSGFQLDEVRGEMWNRFRDTLIEARRQDNNNPKSPRGFGILNGDPRLDEMIWERKFSLPDISTILLFTDGMVPWLKMKSSSDEEVARYALTKIRHGGLAELLLSVRKAEAETISYTTHAEASAVGLFF